MMKNYIVRVHGGSTPCYLAAWRGDPGRTLVHDSAKRFSKQGASIAMGIAKKRFPWREYSLEEIKEEVTEQG